MAAKKPKTTISISDVTNATVDAVGRDSTKKTTGSLMPDGIESDTQIEISHIVDSNIQVVGRDKIDSPSDFQALLSSVEALLSQQLDNQHAKEMLQVVQDVKRENGKAHPDINKIIGLLKNLIKLIPLASLADSTKQQLMNFVALAKTFFHIE